MNSVVYRLFCHPLRFEQLSNANVQATGKFFTVDDLAAFRHGVNWLNFASIGYLSEIDRAGAIALIKTWRVNDNARAWAD